MIEIECKIAKSVEEKKEHLLNPIEGKRRKSSSSSSSRKEQASPMVKKKMVEKNYFNIVENDEGIVVK